MNEIHFTVHAEPVPAPRMNRSDVWKKRPCVLRYRAWKDAVRMACPKPIPPHPAEVRVIFYLEMPESWSQKKRYRMVSTPHRVKPDVDNALKAILDTLWPDNDSMVYAAYAEKRWAWKGQGRAIITVKFTEGADT